jgi:TolB-like protein
MSCDQNPRTSHTVIAVQPFKNMAEFESALRMAQEFKIIFIIKLREQ